MNGTRFYCAHPDCQTSDKGPFFGIVECPSGLGHNLVCGPQVTVDAILEHRGRIVLVWRMSGSVAADTWALPGGFVEFRERLIDAVVREVAEETGLEVTQPRLFGVYDDPKRDDTDCRNNVSIVYTALGVGDLQPQADAQGRYEVAAVRGFTFEEIRDQQFRSFSPNKDDDGPPLWISPTSGLTVESFNQGEFTIGFDHSWILADYFASCGPPTSLRSWRPKQRT
ncbi:MAG: NUDIX hydrolase [Candidatus Zipacnadales bacterium]